MRGGSRDLRSYYSIEELNTDTNYVVICSDRAVFFPQKWKSKYIIPLEEILRIIV